MSDSSLDDDRRRALERENARLRRALARRNGVGTFSRAVERHPTMAVSGGLMLGFLMGAVWPNAKARGPRR